MNRQRSHDITIAEARRVVRSEIGSLAVDRMADYIRRRGWEYEIRGGILADPIPHHARIMVYLMGQTEQERELMTRRTVDTSGHGGKAAGGLHSGTTAHGAGPSPSAGGTSAVAAITAALALAISVYGPQEER